MPRMIFTVTDEMEEDLKREAKRTGATLSGLLRLYVAQQLAAKTKKSVYLLEPGGDRRSEGSKT